MQYVKAAFSLCFSRIHNGFPDIALVADSVLFPKQQGMIDSKKKKKQEKTKWYPLSHD